MKKLIAISLFTIFIASSAVAQSQGPNAKNRKVWKDPKPAVEMYAETGENIKGPVAKNVAPSERKDGDKVLVAFGQRERLMGPNAKNRKPFVNRAKVEKSPEVPELKENGDQVTQVIEK